jgi:hypothetical protein
MVSAKLIFGFAHSHSREKPGAVRQKYSFRPVFNSPARRVFCVSVAIVIGPTPPGHRRNRTGGKDRFGESDGAPLLRRAYA